MTGQVLEKSWKQFLSLEKSRKNTEKILWKSQEGNITKKSCGLGEGKYDFFFFFWQKVPLLSFLFHRTCLKRLFPQKKKKKTFCLYILEKKGQKRTIFLELPLSGMVLFSWKKACLWGTKLGKVGGKNLRQRGTSGIKNFELRANQDWKRVFFFLGDLP